MAELSKSLQNVSDKRGNDEILVQAFLKSYISVIRLDIATGRALVLKADMDQELAGTESLWSELIERYVARHTFAEDRELVRALSLERLSAFVLEGKGEFPVDMRCYNGKGGYQWVEFSVTPVGPDNTTLVVTTRDIDETMMVRRIVDIFVYQNYDYLLLINTKEDSYTRFTGNKGNTPVPPEKGAHYTEDMIRYNRAYVAPEDYERITANMQLSHVIEKLAKSNHYSFTSGGVTHEGTYRRSQVVFCYYDRNEGLVLCARTDVTQIYLEEQEKNRQLSEALREAKHDALTEVYNQKATAELVKRSLESQYRNMAAFLFIDVDNFKMVNDTYGHQKGDELLCFLAHSIKEIAGREGITGRLGGDEFLAYLPGLSSAEEIERSAGSICRLFDDYPDASIDRSLLSCSVGISVYPRDGTDYETLLRKADQALYTSKRYGKNQYYLYSWEVENINKTSGG